MLKKIVGMAAAWGMALLLAARGQDEGGRDINTSHTTEEGKAMLARMPLSRFELADDRRYRVIEDFLRKFSGNVHPLDGGQK